MSGSISELILNLDINIKNNNQATINAIDDLNNKITNALEKKKSHIENQGKEDMNIVQTEKDQTYNQSIAKEEINTEEEIQEGLTQETDIIINFEKTITESVARLELSILRDKIRSDYEDKDMKLLGYENICQMPIVDLILNDNISNLDIWKNSVDALSTPNKKYKRYSDHKKIMDEQLNLYWHQILSIIERIE